MENPNMESVGKLKKRKTQPQFLPLFQNNHNRLSEDVEENNNKAVEEPKKRRTEPTFSPSFMNDNGSNEDTEESNKRLNFKIIGESESQPEVQFLPSFISNPNQFDDGIEETDNGLLLNNVYIPAEIMLHILSLIDPQELLKYSIVCRKWNKLIKSSVMWITLYKRKYDCKRKGSKLPWYVYYCMLTTNYFDNNLLLNGNGQDNLKHWEFIIGMQNCTIEDPVSVHPLPLDISEFNNKRSCFTAVNGPVCKYQQINLGNNKLFHYILDTYKPHIYLSEWTAGRCGCHCYIYTLQCGFIERCKSKNGEDILPKPSVVKCWRTCKWEKTALLVTGYPNGIEAIVFEHECYDVQAQMRHVRGAKMAGGVVEFIFGSMMPPDEDENEIESE